MIFQDKSSLVCLFFQKGEVHMIGRATIFAPDITRAKGGENMNTSQQATLFQAADIMGDRFIDPEETAEILNPLRKRGGLPLYPPRDVRYAELSFPYSLQTLQDHARNGWYLIYSHGAILRNIYTMRGKIPGVPIDEGGIRWPMTYLSPEKFHLVYLGRALKGLSKEAQDASIAVNYHNCERASAVLAAYAFTAIKKTRDNTGDVGGFYYKYENVILALSETEDRIAFYSASKFQGKDIVSTSGACIYRLPDYV